jgi:hypothetical protein
VRIRYAIPDGAVSAPVLNAALETSTRANEALLQRGQMPLATEAIRAGRVRWRPEQFADGEHFDLGHQVHVRGWGDCDDLAPWLAAELRATGRDEGAQAVAKRSGPKRWHAIVRTSDGGILDPSVWAGMREYKKGIKGAINRALNSQGGAFGLRRWRDKFAARADLPNVSGEFWVSGSAIDADPYEALNNSLGAALMCGENAECLDPETMARAYAFREMIRGEDPDDIADALEGAGHDVGFLPIAAALAPSLMSMAAPMISKIMPGGGGPAAPPPAAAAPAGGGGGGGGFGPTVGPTPGGGAPITVTPYNGAPGHPIIVRF